MIYWPTSWVFCSSCWSTSQRHQQCCLYTCETLWERERKGEDSAICLNFPRISISFWRTACRWFVYCSAIVDGESKRRKQHRYYVIYVYVHGTDDGWGVRSVCFSDSSMIISLSELIRVHLFHHAVNIIITISFDFTACRNQQYIVYSPSVFRCTRVQFNDVLKWSKHEHKYKCVAYITFVTLYYSLYAVFRRTHRCDRH